MLDKTIMEILEDGVPACDIGESPESITLGDAINMLGKSRFDGWIGHMRVLGCLMWLEVIYPELHVMFVFSGQTDEILELAMHMSALEPKRQFDDNKSLMRAVLAMEDRMCLAFALSSV